MIEGHRGLRLAISNLLKGMGIEPVETDDTAEVECDNIDLVIMGASCKRSTNINIPTIVITPFKKNDSQNVYYVRQPFEVGELCGTIKRLTKCAG